jgi:hypothetical protein
MLLQVSFIKIVINTSKQGHMQRLLENLFIYVSPKLLYKLYTETRQGNYKEKKSQTNSLLNICTNP